MTPIPFALFSTAATPDAATTAFSVFVFSAILVAVLFRRSAFDVFRADSPVRATKRPVPWHAETAFAIFLCGAFLFPVAALVGVRQLPKGWLPDFAAATETANAVATEPTKIPETTSGENEPTEPNLSTQHPMARLLIRARTTDWGTLVFFVCFFVVAVAAPFQEEFLYRVVVQGTLENVALNAVLPRPSAEFAAETPSAPEFAAANKNADELAPNAELSPAERRIFRRRAVFVVLLPAILFALAHSGAPETPDEAASPETLNLLFGAALATGIANVATLLLGVFILRRFCAATPESLGLGPEFSLRRGRRFATSKRFALDFFRGIVFFVFIAPVVFGVNAALRSAFPNAIVDPAPIFLLALTLGFVYWRTRRYATVVGLHFALNATSFLALCVQFLR